MLTYEISHCELGPEDTDIEMIEEVIHKFGLSISNKTTLSSKKGSIHYHLKYGKDKGILELTYWSRKQQLLVEIHDNRRAVWNIELIKPFSNNLCNRFNGTLKICEKSG